MRHQWESTPIGVRFALALTLILTALFTPWLYFNMFYFGTVLDTHARFTQMHQVKITELVIEREMMNILRHAEDNSVWNEARKAVLRRDRAWLNKNIVEWLAQHFHYDVVAVIFSDGELLTVNGKNGEWVSALPLVQNALKGKGDAGLLQHNGTVYMVGVSPICDEDWVHPPAGVLVLAKSLNATQLARISEQTGSQLTLTLGTQPSISPSSEAGVQVAVLTLRDPMRKPIALLHVASPFSETQLARQLLYSTKRHLLLVSVAVALLASLVLVWFLRVYITRFLTAIHRLASGDWEARIPYAARDEFGFLAQTFNSMALQIQQAFEAQHQQREKIQAQNEELQALYKQLQAAHQELAQLNAELVEANRALAQAAITDGLTGLKNHRAFQESLHSLVQMAERHQQPLSLIMLDIDYFKQFNDRFGHPAGDELLKQVAEVISQSARAYDVAARYGGEEFALLLPNTTLEQAVQVAERLRSLINAIRNPHARISASLGVATYRYGTAPALLLYEADAALYRAKRSGRNQVCVYQPEAA